MMSHAQKVFQTLLVLTICVVFSSTVWANSGIYQTVYPKGGKEYQDKQREEMVKIFMQKLVQAMVLKTSGEVVEETVKNSKLNMLPQIGMQSVNVIAMQTLKQEPLLEFVRDLYQRNFEYANRQLEAGNDPQSVQEDVKDKVEREMKEIVYEPAYQYVVEQVLQRSMAQQQQILLMQAFQQQMKLQSGRKVIVYAAGKR